MPNLDTYFLDIAYLDTWTHGIIQIDGQTVGSTD